MLSDLYYTVSAVIDSPLKDSINGFSQVLHDYTSSISSEVGSRIKIDSKLSIPDNLSDLFRTLVFQTSYTEHNSIPLSMRGDGIQARHIPIVLKYIADEDTKICKKGSMKVSTIWGFEEPENGVELRKAFEMSKDFVDYSEDIQMFITTHSPAFYSINNSNKAQVIYVSSGEKNQGTKLSKSHSSISIGDTMGLMPVVAPFIREKEEELDAVRQLIDDNNLYDVDTIFVEGETDIKYLTLAINLFSTKLKNLIDSKKLLFFTRPGEGGCKKLYNYALAWIYSGNKSKALMLFDKDKAGKLAKQEITEDSVYKSKLNKSKVKADFISPSPILQTLLNKHINIPFEVESLLSTDFLRIMYEKELLEKRSQDELFDMVKKIMPVDKTVSELLYEKCSNSEVVDLIILNVPKDKKKNAIYDCLNNFSTENQKAYMEGFKPTISFLEKYFCK